MEFIRIVSHPHPNSQEPDFVRRAYAGLCLKPSQIVPPGERERWPQGFYLVPVEEFLKKMKGHNEEAYGWLAPRWGKLDEAMKDAGQKIQLFFPTNCCFECDSETIQ